MIRHKKNMSTAHKCLSKTLGEISPKEVDIISGYDARCMYAYSFSLFLFCRKTEEMVEPSELAIRCGNLLFKYAKNEELC